MSTNKHKPNNKFILAAIVIRWIQIPYPVCKKCPFYIYPSILLKCISFSTDSIIIIIYLLNFCSSQTLVVYVYQCSRVFIVFVVMQVLVPNSRRMDNRWALPVIDLHATACHLGNAVGFVPSKGNSWGPKDKYDGQGTDISPQHENGSRHRCPENRTKK